MTPTSPVRLMIVGAPKAGTTALKHYLGQHPGIRTHEAREFQFFANEERFSRGYDQVFPMYFAGGSDDRLVCAKSVAMLYSEDALTRLQLHNPDVHVVVSLRNPVDRAYSEFWYARRRGWEPLTSFEAAIRADAGRFGKDAGRRQRCAYLERSNYAPFVEALLRRFAPDRVQVILTDDLARDTVAVCRSLFARFPELDADFVPSVERRTNAAAMPRSQSILRLTWSPSALPQVRSVMTRVLPESLRQSIKEAVQRMNERPVASPPMDPSTRALLTEHFREANVRLGELLERDLSPWNKLEAPAPPTDPAVAAEAEAAWSVPG